MDEGEPKRRVGRPAVTGMTEGSLRAGVPEPDLDAYSQVMPVRLVEIRPGPSKFRRRYTWQFLVVRRPRRDPYRLLPCLARPAAVAEIAEDGGDILGDLKDLLASEIADGAVARFTAEGGFELQRA
jgi:hypothetical protein